MFHAPNYARIRHHPMFGTTDEAGNNGVFQLASPEPGWGLWLVLSDGGEWEHVSVHAHRGSKMRTPTWKEMAFAKNICWDAEDAVFQIHPPRSEYVNTHPHVLHLWRLIGAEFPRPPREFV